MILWKYHYLSLLKPNALLAKCSLYQQNLNCFFNFQAHKILKKHELFCEDHGHREIITPKGFKLVLNKAPRST